MFGLKPVRLMHGRGARGREVLLFGILLLVGQVSEIGPAAAQLAGCEAALRPAAADENTMTFVLALDRISVSEPVTGLENPETLAAGLAFKIATNLEDLELAQTAPKADDSGVMNVRFRVDPCPQRWPQASGDISDDAERFLKNRVVLELWGLFDLDEAIFSHAILPLYVRGAPPHVQAGEVFTLSYSYQASDAGATRPELRFLKKILLTSLPLRAYAAAGVAAIALEEQQYDLARRYYCSVRQVMLDFESERGRLSSRDRRLLAYAEELSREVIAMAQAKPDYNGLLGSDLIPSGTGCTGLLS
jgi:hypothetical protein